MADLDGRIAYANPTMCRLIGEPDPTNVIGRPMWAYYQEGVKERRTNEIIPALDRDGFWDGELPMLSRRGTLVPPLHHVFLLRDEEGQPIRRCVVVTDISERKRAEAALRASEERYDLAVRGAGVGIFDWDILTGKVYYSAGWKRLLGYEDNDIADGVEDWTRLLHPDERDSIIERQDDFFAGTSSIATAEYRLRHKDGSYRWIMAHVLVVRNEQGKACRLVGSHSDVTDRKRAEEALERERRNLQHLLQSSDHERQLIAYEIHDGLAQQLAGAVMQFETFTHQKNTQPGQAEDAFNAGLTMLRQSHFEARRLIAGVRPPILDEAGVMSAIAHLVHEPVRGTRQQIDFHSRVQFDRLVPTLENAIYRIVQEGLTNACQHSKSEKVRVSLLQRGDRVRIEIRDWGIGFDVKAVPKKRFGLEGIRQRARLLGGKCSIRSKPGKGTTITVELPVVARK